MKVIESPVQTEVMEAYCDSHELNFEATLNRRNLNFKASEAMPRDEAVALMKRAIPEGYNEFKAELLKLLPKDSMITIAREGSVCIYVTPNVKEIKKMKADEWDDEGECTRIWWD